MHHDSGGGNVEDFGSRHTSESWKQVVAAFGNVGQFARYTEGEPRTGVVALASREQTKILHRGFVRSGPLALVAKRERQQTMMSNTRDDHVLPRPVERLPAYANAKARTNAAVKLTELFGLSQEAARSFADAAVNPAELRKAADAPERIPVPGGTILGIRASAWSRRVIPDPRNPRVGPARRHPFAVDPGTSEDSRFRPAPEPTSNGIRPELAVAIESREHLTWAADQAKRYVLHENDWRDSIKSQGVMTEVWVTASTYSHEDGSPDLCMPTTAEGSSRMTGVHDILDERSVDLAYDTGDRQMRSVIRRLNDAFDRGSSDTIAMRCETVPCLFLVGFEPHHDGTEEFATAVKSLVALRHVDPPKPWGEGPEMESLADAALDELERQGVLTTERRQWMAGSITREEAERAHLSSDPAVRAAAIVEVFTSDDQEARDAIRLAVTAQSTRKRMTPKLLNQLATALIIRAVGGEGDHSGRIRRYMRHGFAKALNAGDWKATTRATDQLVAEALKELKDDPEDGGPAGFELAARAAYPLITTLKLWGDQGSGRDQPDRRTPGEVIDVMRRNPGGVQQLGRALEDYGAGLAIRAVDASGAIVQTADGTQQHINDTYLRNSFPAPGTVKRPASPETANEKLEAAVSELGGAVESLEEAVAAVQAVKGVDGSPLVDSQGFDGVHCKAWRGTLGDIDDLLVIWGQQHRKHAGGARLAADADGPDDSEAEPADALVDIWDADAESDEETTAGTDPAAA